MQGGDRVVIASGFENQPAVRPAAPPAREPLRRRFARLAARTVRTKTVVARPHPPLVSFTFDDIPESAYAKGAALVEEAGGRGTFYVAGGLVGVQEPHRRLADAGQCRDLHRRGHEIACHTFSHGPVAALRRAPLAEDIARNRSRLTEVDAGIVLENFAYPFNATSLKAKRQLERHFRSCRGGVPGINAGRIDLGYLRAVELADRFLDEEAVRAWIARAVKARGWLIFFSHGIAEEPEPWGCHPRLLSSALRESRAQGAAIVTVAEALTHVHGEPTNASQAAARP